MNICFHLCLHCLSKYKFAYRCDRCPLSTYSNGSTACLPCHDNVQCPCRTKTVCYPRAPCSNLGEGLFQCGSCPPGFQGDGVNCMDINEVL